MHLVNVGSGFSGCLHILNAPLFCFPSSLVHRHLPAILKVGLVSNQQERDLVFFCLHSQDLLPTDTASMKYFWYFAF